MDGSYTITDTGTSRLIWGDTMVDKIKCINCTANCMFAGSNEAEPKCSSGVPTPYYEKVVITLGNKRVELPRGEFHRIWTSACCQVIDQVKSYKQVPLGEIVEPSFGHGTDPLDTVGLDNTLDNWRSAEGEYKKIMDVEKALGL